VFHEIAEWYFKKGLITYNTLNDVKLDKKGERELRLREVAIASLIHFVTPIFTFTVNDNRFDSQPWFTGGLSMLMELEKHIEDEGGKIETNENLYVPFSNGDEMGHNGDDYMRSELQFVTTREQFCETFGIDVSEIRRQAYSRQQ